MNSLIKATLLMCAYGAAPAFGATQLGEHLQVNGFGTLGVAQTDNSEYEFVRRGQTEGTGDRLDFNLDSNLGVQGTIQPATWISGTVQLLARHRAEPNISAEVEWAFVKLEPLNRLELRGGRMQLPMFAVSDFRNVNYANTWARAPDEVYGLSLLERLEGVDATYRLPLGSTTLTLTVLNGKSFFYSGFDDLRTDANNVRGANVQWEIDGVTLRLGEVKADMQVNIGGIPGLTAAPSDPYTFSGAGIGVDRNRIVTQAEYVMRRSKNYPTLVDTNGWYVLGGYRFGHVLPYVIFGNTQPIHSSPVLQLTGRQTTAAIGVRWDVVASAAFKLQVQRVDTHDTRGVSFAPNGVVSAPSAQGAPVLGPPVTAIVNVASLSLDFIF